MKNLFFIILIYGGFCACVSENNSSNNDKQNTDGDTLELPVLSNDGGLPVFEQMQVSKVAGSCINYPDSACLDVKISFPQLTNGTDSLNNSVQEMVLEYVSDFMASEKEPNEQPIHNYLKEVLEEEVIEMETLESEPPYILDLEVDIKSTFVNASYSCFECGYYVNTGGAHPNSTSGYFILDNKSGTLLTNDDIIDADAKFKEMVLTGIKEQHDLKPDQDISEAGFFVTDSEFELNNNIGVRNDSLFMTYVPYEIAPYVMGYTYLTFSQSDLKGVIDEQFLKKWNEK